MKVLHTLDSLNRGGAETLCLDVCRNAQRFGIDLTFVSTGEGRLEEDFKNSGAEYVSLQRDSPFDLQIIWQLRKIIKERNIKIVQGYQPVEILHLYFATLGMKDVHVVQSHQGYIEGRKNLMTAKFLSPRIAANIACSRGLFPCIRNEIGLNTSKNFYLVYNGVDPKRLESKGGSIKEDLEVDEKTLLLGMVANFRPDQTKDQMTVCRALPKVFEKFDNANFIFIGQVSPGGENNFEECIKFCDENGIGEKVFFLGQREDIPEILDSLDLFVFSSLKEGLPISVAEAMFKKVPMIVSDIPPLLEATNNGKCAETFQIKNDIELSKKILKLLKSKKRRKKLTKHAFQFAQQTFSIEAHFRGLTTLYSDLLNENETNNDEIPQTNEKAEKSDSIFELD